MKSRFICFLSYLFFFSFPCSVFAFQGDSIIVTLTMPKKNIDTFTDLRLNVKVKSNVALLVPHEENWALIQDSSGLLCVQLQKKNGSEYKDMVSSARIDNLFYY